MTSDTVIRAEGLGKKYIIGHQSADRINTFRDLIMQNVKNFVRSAKDMAQGKAIVAGDELEEFWALKEVNFEINRGDVVGIIGRNGAGKSTLLKVLSRITEPTEGRVEVKGRVASLLEVGTGFHPELSGRENIYLNGAILGMSHAEITRKFDEIVDFSGVEKFLDTPVKRYSSGMYVRLAFAVAAHLEPEILVIDEVLAVGDTEFQKKCLGKMQDVAGQGRTVLFVSHNMAAVQNICSTSFILDRGSVCFSGKSPDAIAFYNQFGMAQYTQHWMRPLTDNQSGPQYRSVAIRLVGEQPELKLIIDAVIDVPVQSYKMFIAADISDMLGVTMMQAEPVPSPFISGEKGERKLQLEIDLPGMVPGMYCVSFWLGAHNTETYDFIESVVQFEVLQSPTVGRQFPHTPDHGYIVPKSKATVT
jgi:lipopolysaccharide transport system ATP-binding protein